MRGPRTIEDRVYQPDEWALVSRWDMCDICKNEYAIYDGKTIFGPWALMCYNDFINVGVGVGEGKGQRLIRERGAPINEPND